MFLIILPKFCRFQNHNYTKNKTCRLKNVSWNPIQSNDLETAGWCNLSLLEHIEEELHQAAVTCFEVILGIRHQVSHLIDFVKIWVLHRWGNSKRAINLPSMIPAHMFIPNRIWKQSWRTLLVFTYSQRWKLWILNLPVLWNNDS